MPLILDASQYPADQLRTLLRDQREGLEFYLELFRNPPARVLDPASLRAASDLPHDTITAIDRIDSPSADSASLAAAANLGYSVMLATIDLWKSHADVSKVPRRSAPPAP
ncbi:MAG: hypothetical protein L3K00_00560 [Thermoplasmata archaeon]|nr:hypothetical protein [Thermoplasmata archaeon]